MKCEDPSPLKPKRRWLRYSLRTLMMLTAVVAVGCGMWMRSDGFQREAERHRLAAIYARIAQAGFENVGRHADSHSQWKVIAIHHEQLLAKYEQAARYSWIPVAADPPAPDLPLTD